MRTPRMYFALTEDGRRAILYANDLFHLVWLRKDLDRLLEDIPVQQARPEPELIKRAFVAMVNQALGITDNALMLR